MIDASKVAAFRQKILGEVSKVIIGKDEIKQALMLALIAGGHLLIEGSPGTAKTKLAKSFAQAIGGSFKRIQFTPDMLPADITGFYLYSPVGNPTFVEGPIFANVVLADELNRTTPRTQSALIEAMQEHQVTIEKKTYPLESPFMVIATQIQSGAEGTYPLTDVQVDRFLLRIVSGYPTVEEEMQVITNIDRIDESNIAVMVSVAEVMEARVLAKQVHVSPDIVKYIMAIIGSLRSDPDILAGPSTRASIALYKCARVLALFDGREYVVPDDVKQVAYLALEHRIKVKPEAEMDDVTPKMLVDRALERVAVPKLAL